jgi:hypothetical protein
MSLAGRGPLTMVIDTGASENMLTPEAAVRIGLTVPAGNDGILGYPFLSHFVFTIDYRRAFIRLFQSGVDMRPPPALSDR